jgi:hypothetical protein
MENALILLPELSFRLLTKFAIDTLPTCGTPEEALAYYKVEGCNLTKAFLKL